MFYGFFLWERTKVSRNKTLGGILTKHKNTKIADLPTDLQVTLGFLTLIVDIKYRDKYGCKIDGRSNNSYDKEVKLPYEQYK